ncbi:hypothetical protein BP6252_05211 [Coleophoma cylindrospora]|uniref:Uncharacterized protein n=1 Tax=Coleophoma cylindrospora TaxID=1849047 RepID=A0A3D8RT65_9HELO|nr:hypothetical protein BP6252_05211 [Coleophoma cylindrospora]
MSLEDIELSARVNVIGGVKSAAAQETGEPEPKVALIIAAPQNRGESVFGFGLAGWQPYLVMRVYRLQAIFCMSGGENGIEIDRLAGVLPLGLAGVPRAVG